MRKERSYRFPEVMYQKWKTPLEKLREIRLGGVLQGGGMTHFFFHEVLRKPKIIIVMSIDRGRPYRIHDEGLGYSGGSGKYFISKPTKKKKKVQPFFTWKLWNTDYIKEIDYGMALSRYAKERDKTICQYRICAYDDDIECISNHTPPKWKIHKTGNLKKLMQEYMKKEF